MGKWVSSFTVWSRDPGFRNSIVFETDKSDEMTEWCKENLIGSFGYSYRNHISLVRPGKKPGWTIIIFEEEDAMAFKLRWS